MTGSRSPEDMDRQFGALWAYARHLETRIAGLETWKARDDAVSSWRRWAAPVALYAFGLALTVLNLLH